MAISFGSIGTGLPKDIVQQIMAAERVPLQNMEARKGKIGEKKGLVQELIGLAEKMRGSILQNGNERSLRELKVESNEEIVGVSTDKNIAEPGTYQFEVVKLAQKSSAMSSGFEDPDESYVGVGFIQYTLPDGSEKSIYVDSDNASLNKIAKLINSDKENGLRASVINDGSGSETPWRLLMSLDKTGDANMAHFPYFYFVDGEQDLYLEFEREAHDAVVKIDGFEVELEGNKADKLIPGVTIDLKKARPGEEFTIKIAEDTIAVAEKINGLVESINEVFKFIKTQNTMDENTDTSRTLGGDIMLQSLEGRLRSAIFKDVITDWGPKKLSDLGIKFEKSGLLAFDEKQFNNTLSSNYQLAAQILTGKFGDGTKTNGVVDNLNEVLTTILRNPDGLLQSRKNSLQNNIDQIDRRISEKERHLEQKEKNLKEKFARLEETVSRIKSQGAGLSALGAQAAAVPQLG